MILESLVDEGRLRAVRFFGNLAAVGTLFLIAKIDFDAEKRRSYRKSSARQKCQTLIKK